VPFYRHLLSAISLLVVLLNLVFWIIPLLVLALLKLMAGQRSQALHTAMAAIYRTAVRMNDLWLRKVLRIHWHRPVLDLAPDEVCLVISNHRSWIDILLIQSLISRRGPIVKFLTKRELMYIPIIGQIIWAFEFPSLHRRAARGQNEAERRQVDAQRIVDACANIDQHPCAFLTFPEGTRFSENKHKASSSPYRTLLRPRGGGYALLCEALNTKAAKIVDVTIAAPANLNFWKFLSGSIRLIPMHVEVLNNPNLTGDGAIGWLNDRWLIKDQTYTTMFQQQYESRIATQ
jgi:1-acyl-sn-glycerol-3-phosphate acyltransferase